MPDLQTQVSSPPVSVTSILFGQHRPPMEASFATIEEARDWLHARGGGAISAHDPAINDWRVVETVTPG